jgi:hypothetical protein
MEMTTPVFTRKGESNSETMDMTTPVITKKVDFGFHLCHCFELSLFGDSGYFITKKVMKFYLSFLFVCHLQLAGKNKWKMSFVMPAKYGSNLPRPKDPSVTIKEVPSKIVAVAAFSGP